MATFVMGRVRVLGVCPQHLESTYVMKIGNVHSLAPKTLQKFCKQMFAHQVRTFCGDLAFEYSFSAFFFL
jgi:hypothetical protein